MVNTTSKNNHGWVENPIMIFAIGDVGQRSETILVKVSNTQEED